MKAHDGTAASATAVQVQVSVTPANTAPTFVGATTTLNLSQNASATDIKSLLHASDTDSGQTLTWSESSAPSHGSLSFSGATAASGSTDITPGGTITYTPASGYAGTDSFSVQVSDGTASATRAISVNVTAPPVLSPLPDLQLSVNTSVHPGAADLATFVTDPDSASATMQFRIVNLDQINAAFGLSDGQNGGVAGIPVVTIGMDPDSGTFKVRPGVGSQDNTIHVHPRMNFTGSTIVTIEGRDADGNISNQSSFTVSVNAAPNIAPTFVGATTTLSVSQNASAMDIKSLLHVGDSDSGQTLTWTQSSAPAHGTLSISAATASSGSADITPGGTITYTPASGFSGTDSFTIQVSDGTASATRTISVTITPLVTNAPVIKNLQGDSFNYLEGDGAVVLDKATAATVTDANSPDFDKGTLTVSIVTGKAAAEDLLGIRNQGTGAGQIGVKASSVSFGGKMIGTISGGTVGNNLVVTFNASSSPAAAAALLQNVTYLNNNTGQPTSGTRTVRFVLTDGDGETSDPAEVTVTVSPVNDPPSFVKGANVTILEGAEASGASRPQWATKITPGLGEEKTGQTVAFLVSNDNAGLFSVPPAISAVGTLTFTVAGSDLNGVAKVTVKLKDDGGTANGGKDTSAEQTFIITVTPVNDVPSFTKGPDQTVLEDAGKQTIAGWAKNLSAGPADEQATQKLSFVVSNDNNALFSAQPAVSPDGTLTFTPASNGIGAAKVTVIVKDNGGTSTGGVNSSAAQTFTVTVGSLNDAPSFTKGADVKVLEDSGAKSIPTWAKNIKAGPPDESPQTVTFQVSNNNAALFSVPPAISSDGTLTFTVAAPDINGVAEVTATLKDNGGTAGGGKDTSAAQTFKIIVTAVNDAPSFTKGPDQTVLEDAGKQTVAGWAKNLSAGPANESTQTLSFAVSNDNKTLFSAQPAVRPDGTLTFTPASNGTGVANVTVAIKDTGGTANGGVSTSAGQTFTIAVTSLNDAPSFTKGANVTALEDSGAKTIDKWAKNIKAGPPNESLQTVTFQVSNDNAALFSVPPAISSDGTLTFTVAGPDLNGVAKVTVKLKDDGGTAGGGKDTSAEQTFIITVTPVNDVPSFTKGPDQTV
ncbi:MAG: Ig-like domain-containing protein, partial [Verrucomicrobia bacterium]|nr:Ig-like domain-containing protein [Verrucomicrobiota bacterium]